MDERTTPVWEEDSALEVVSETEQRFERLRRQVGFYLAPLAFAATWALTAKYLATPGSRLSAVLAGVLVLWMCESIPMPMTAVLGACLCVIMGIADAKTALAPFADPIIFLFIGSFILGRAMRLHRLDRRFALAILSLRGVGEHPARLLCVLGLVTTAISMWVSNTATAAMMLPIALGLLNALRDVGASSAAPRDMRQWPFATGTMLMVAYAASIGGIGTPVGSPPNLIGIGLIRQWAGVDINFFQWMAIGVPLCAVMYLALFGLLYWLHPAEAAPRRDHRGSAEIPPARADRMSALQGTEMMRYLQKERESLGGWTRGQVNTLIAFGVAVVLWMAPGALALALGKNHVWVKWAEAHLPEGIVALLAACLLFALPTNRREGAFTLTWQEATRIDWGTILLFGGGMSLGGLMFSTGVADAIGRSVTSLTGAQSLWGLTAAAIALGILVSETTSNTASANMIIPVVIALAKAANVNPVPPALGACLGASYGFMLPVSTPPNAIVYGSGLVPIPKMVRAGVIFDLCGFLLIWLGLRALCPLMGWR
ncbi:MAG: SLC13 family permease [Abditibacteriales bacterium]|nr:SLC13 family permease [Abditibacteriales bacterium]MDW8364334.1 SLC13 family permease [Abditibacteriales bacterium]